MIPRDDLTAVSLAHLHNSQGWQQQYRWITQWGKLIQPKLAWRQPDYLLKGCETPVWLGHEQQGENHVYWFDSDSRVINGLAALLLAQVNGKTQADIMVANLHGLLASVGLEKHLTPSRNNGLHNIISRIEQLASGTGVG